MNIEKMKIEELKALCYDQYKELTRVQNNINLIEQEIAKKEQDGILKRTTTI